jgi:hypothetical protein
MMRSRIVASLLLCMACSTTASSAAPAIVSREQGYRNEEAVLRYVRPVLQSSGAAALIYYHTDCQADDDYPIPFPKLVLRTPRVHATGVLDIRDIFRSSKQVSVADAEPRLVHIIIGSVPEALLDTEISSLVLRPGEQYDVQSAFRAIEDTVEFQQTLRKLGMRGIPRPYNLPVQSPVAGLPHLPASLTNITVDHALDTIAKKFDVIVVLGYCDSPPTYDLTYTGIKEW